MLRNVLIQIMVGIVCVGVGLGCSRERLASPCDDQGDNTGGPGTGDTTGIWLQVAPDWGSVYVFLRGPISYKLDYKLFRSNNDSTHYRDISHAERWPGVWDDGGAGEGRTYYYKVVAFESGRRIGCTAATPITVRSPKYVLERLEHAYNKRDLAVFESLLSDDYVFDSIVDNGKLVSCDKATDVGIHKKMFNPRIYRTDLTRLSLDLKRVRLSRTPDEEDWLHFLCFEVVADVDLRLEFDPRYSDKRPIHYTREAYFRIKHSKADPTQWVIYRWWDPK